MGPMDLGAHGGHASEIALLATLVGRMTQTESQGVASFRRHKIVILSGNFRRVMSSRRQSVETTMINQNNIIKRYIPNWFLIASRLKSSMKVWLPTFGTRLKNSNSTSLRAVLFSSHGSGSTSSCNSCTTSSDLITSDSRVRCGLLRSW